MATTCPCALVYVIADFLKVIWNLVTFKFHVCNIFFNFSPKFQYGCYPVHSYYMAISCPFVLFVCLIWFFTSHQQSLSYKGTGLPGWTSTKLGLLCLAQEHNAVTLVRLEPGAPRPQVKHSTTESLRSLHVHLYLWRLKLSYLSPYIFQMSYIHYSSSKCHICFTLLHYGIYPSSRSMMHTWHLEEE